MSVLEKVVNLNLLEEENTILLNYGGCVRWKLMHGNELKCPVHTIGGVF